MTPSATSETDLRQKEVSVSPAQRAAHATAVSVLKKVWIVPGLSDEQRSYRARLVNDQLRDLEYQMGVGELSCWPRTIELPVAGNCNLRCEMCSLAHGAPTYPFWTHADIAPFTEFFKYADTVNPTGVGEPLMGREFFPMVEEFTRHGAKVGFYTNATLLNEAKARRLIELKVDTVNVSIDGATPETFERIRKPAKFDTVIKNVRRLIELRREAGANRPGVQLAMVLMGDTIHELPLLVRLAHDLGAESVYGMFVTKAGPNHQPRLAQTDPRRTNEFLREARRLGEELRLRVWIPGLLPEPDHQPIETGAVPAATCGGKVYCAYPWNQYLVHNDGSVAPCCKIRGDVDGLSFGNVKDGPPEKHWNSPGMIRLRERLLRNDPPGVCRNCALRTATISTG